ncbi:MAG: Uncharacterized protein FD153_1365 [Rhodospirillaceae bacterium]|nr:MAG: Uncharacterized protein FD153_1365 [Rhodospirillaceae bacterium]
MPGLFPREQAWEGQGTRILGNGEKQMKTQSSVGAGPKGEGKQIQNGHRCVAAVVVTLMLLPDPVQAVSQTKTVARTMAPQTIGTSGHPVTARPKTNGLSALVADELNHLLAPRQDNVSGGGDAIRQFYQSRRYQPLWVGEEGVVASAKELIEVLKTADREGLLPQGYGMAVLEHGMKAHMLEALARFDSALTAVFVRYVQDLKHGRVRARDVEPGLFPDPPPLDVTRLLKEATRTKDFSRFLASLAPSAPGYHRLRETLERYRALADSGGWPAIPQGQNLRPGMAGPRVVVLRQRLRVTGELRLEDEVVAASEMISDSASPVPASTGLPAAGQGEENRAEKSADLDIKRPAMVESPEPEGPPPVRFTLAVPDSGMTNPVTSDADGASLADDKAVFDHAVEEAVRRFQRRHGLEADGIVGVQTLAMLNVPVEARMRQIVVTMERWRWVPSHLGQRYVMVNIPAAFLEVWENGRVVLGMKVVVGQPRRQTPVFKVTLTHLVLNPLWNVPHKLAVEDVAEKARKNPAYMARQGIRVFTTIDDTIVELDPLDVDWHQVGRNRFPYRLRQDAGPNNAMGKMKFLMPNPDDIYLHDTPTRHLFQRASRAESSGCIRLEKPIDLAVYLLNNQAGWSREKIAFITAGKKTETVSFRKPVPVYLVYQTVWVDDDGIVQFRMDLYKRDALLAKALFGAS